MRTRNMLLGFAAAVLVIGGAISSGALGLTWQNVGDLLRLPTMAPIGVQPTGEGVRIATEESVVIDVVERVSPAVVTVGITQTRRIGDIFEFNPFDPFAPFSRPQGESAQIEQDIGSGFIVDGAGLIVTNKHVVSVANAKYRVITKDDKTYDVTQIYRDPANDMAILKINATGLPEAELGDSEKIKVGQLAIAIGTALGEFRHTVTTGVISGIGRGIDAGSPFTGSERLENVIQTDAAINPGNSGGPLLNSAGQVIGVNVAIAAEGENIGFAIPINVVKDAIANFNQTGQFNRPFLGVEYRMVTRQLAILNEIPEGAYIVSVVDGSPAERAGVEAEDIITHIDGTKLSGEGTEIASVLGKKKVGDTVSLKIWRNGEDMEVKATLGNQAEQ